MLLCKTCELPFFISSLLFSLFFRVPNAQTQKTAPKLMINFHQFDFKTLMDHRRNWQKRRRWEIACALSCTTTAAQHIPFLNSHISSNMMIITVVGTGSERLKETWRGKKSEKNKKIMYVDNSFTLGSSAVERKNHVCAHWVDGRPGHSCANKYNYRLKWAEFVCEAVQETSMMSRDHGALKMMGRRRRTHTRRSKYWI